MAGRLGPASRAHNPRTAAGRIAIAIALPAASLRMLYIA